MEVHAAKAESVKQPRLRDQMRDVLTLKRYKRSTIRQYLDWGYRFAAFHRRDPREMREPEIKAFLTHLAVDGRVSWSTQRSAMNALVCLYREVLQVKLGDFGQFSLAAKPKRLPVVISREQVLALIAAVAPEEVRLVCQLLYGCGLRLNEGLDLRIQDVDFERGQIMVRAPKQDHDRVVMLPESLRELVRQQIERMRLRWQHDGGACVSLPDAIARKYRHAERDFGWQYVFGAKSLSTDPADGRLKRWHLRDNTIQKAVSAAKYRVGIMQRFTPHCFRHCFGTHLYEAGYDIYRIKELMGHKKIETTQIYIHMARKPAECVKSPID